VARTTLSQLAIQYRLRSLYSLCMVGIVKANSNAAVAQKPTNNAAHSPSQSRQCRSRGLRRYAQTKNGQLLCMNRYPTPPIHTQRTNRKSSPSNQSRSNALQLHMQRLYYTTTTPVPHPSIRPSSSNLSIPWFSHFLRLTDDELLLVVL
jgi:hypothetical protein